MYKKIIIGTSSLYFGLILLASVIIGFSFKEVEFQKNTIWYDDVFSKIEVENENYIKGVDASSYAEVVEKILWNQGIKKDYSQITSEEQNLFKNFEGEKVNLFSLLSDNGVNSLRLRLWNDPYNENGISYSGGHNDILTDIWIANQAAANGIDSIFLDLHYSDFWADPNRQWLPKKWANYENVEWLKNEVFNYTYDSLKIFYENTNIVPDKIQIGNKITKGAFWDTDGSGKNDFNTTSTILKGGFEAVEKFEKELEVSIKTSIHIDGTPTLSKWKKILDSYLIKNNLIDYVDEIGITHYPDFNGTAKKLYDIMTLIKEDYNLSSFVAETATPSTVVQTNNSRDQISSQGNIKKYLENPSAASQVKIMASIMETSSKALPNDETGFYWWEPSWIFESEVSWATREGIIYAEPINKENQKSFLTGNTWWNRGFFDIDGNPLPVLREIKSFNRINSNKVFDGSLIYTGSTLKHFRYDVIFQNQSIFKGNGAWENDIDFNKTVNLEKFKVIKTTSTNLIENAFLEKNQSIIKSQIEFSDFNFDSTGGSFIVSSSDSNYYYKLFENILVNFEFEVYNNKQFTIDNSSNVIEISSTNTNWLQVMLEQLNSNADLNKNLTDNLWKTIVPEFYFEKNYSWWGVDSNGTVKFYDSKIDKNDGTESNRYLKTWFLIDKSDSIIYDDTTNYETLNSFSSWPETLKKGVYSINLFLTKSVDYDLYGMENWKDLKTVSVLYSVKVV